MEPAEKESAPVARSQHVVFTLPPDRAHVAQFMAPVVARVDRAVEAPQVIVVTPDAEMALAVVSSANDAERPVSVLPVTGARRAARLLKARPAQLVAGEAGALLELVRSASLKLEAVRSVVVAWADHVYDAGEGEALEALFGELPKDGARTVVVERMTGEVDSLIERHLRRARRVEAPAGAEGETGAVSALVTSSDGRRRALRRLLDELDPERALVVAPDDAAAAEAEGTVAMLGHAGEQAVRVAREPDDVGECDLVVLYGLPASRDPLVTIASAGPARVIAIVEARQMPALRRLAGSVTPFAFPEAARDARRRDESLRDELRRELAQGVPTRELLAVEPLLGEHDGAELAAAALRLLERERAAKRAAGAETQAAGAPVEGGFAKVFLTIGSRDNVTPGDLVGAITGESGITSKRLGKIDIRESFSLVEVAAADAEKVIAAMAGASVRGRRLAARLDREVSGDSPRERGGAPRGRPRPDGDRPSRPRGDRPPTRGSSGPRDREFKPRDRDFKPRGRDDKPRGRPAGPRDRDDKPRGRPSRDRDVGGPRRDRESLPPEREQWNSRGDAMRNARRGPRRTEGETDE